jgi:hypothetical protein
VTKMRFGNDVRDVMRLHVDGEIHIYGPAE